MPIAFGTEISTNFFRIHRSICRARMQMNTCDRILVALLLLSVALWALRRGDRSPKREA
jgi:hypothetical protein